MSSVKGIEQAIEALEQQRAILGDATVNTAIATLKQQLTEHRSSAERKLVTVMFADISGFTALSEKKDPEEVRSLMNQCFDTLVPLVIKYNGTVDKFIGDEIMALFGAPLANEKHAELACYCSLDMLDEIQRFNLQHGLSLGLHIGLNTGLVVAGGIGSEGRQQYSVMGDPVNLGARLKDKAANGQIFTGPELYNITAALFEYERLKPVYLKGKEDAVQIYSLKGRINQPTRDRFSAASPLIGREKELKIFQHCVDLLNSKKGSTISIIGEAGIGKSRLLNECQKKFAEDKNWYEGGAFSHLSQVSYHPVKQMLLKMMQGEIAENNESLRYGLADLLKIYPETTSDSLFPFLASLLGISLTENENTAIRYPDPVTLRQQLQGAFVQFIKLRAEADPVILFWEDIHWADKETLQVIEKICTASIDYPIINLLSFRPEKEDAVWQLHEKLSAIGNYQILELEPLSAEENQLMIQALGHNDETFHEAAKIIFDKSEGNPFYTEELYRVLREQGYFEKEKPVLIPVSSIDLPNTLQGIVASRIDKLRTGEKWVLQTSAAIGRIIDKKTILSLIESEKKEINLEAAIAGLLSSDMIRSRDSSDDGTCEYFFKHAITQDVAYNSLLISTRKEIHNRVGDAFSKLYGPDHYFIAAIHFEKGENNEKAFTCYKKAAMYAAGNFAHENEVTSYLKAIELAKLLFLRTSEKQWKKELCDLLEKNGDIYNKQTLREEALNKYEEAFKLTDPQDWIRKAALNRKMALCFEVIHSSSKKIIEDLYRASEELLNKEVRRGDKWQAEWLEIQLDKCWAYYWQNELDLLQATLVSIEKSIHHYASVFQKAKYLYTKSILEFRLLSFQLTQDSIDISIEGVQLSQQTNDLKMMVNGWFQLGFAYLWANKIEQSIDVYERHREEGNKLGDKVMSTRGIIYLFVGYRRLGNVTKTEELVNEYLHSGKFPQIPEYILQASGTLIWTSWKKRDFDGVKKYYSTCSHYLKPGVANTPFRFLYAMPMIAYYYEINEMEKVIPFLKDLVLPNQRRLETDLRAAIDNVLQEYETGKKMPRKDVIKIILDLAEQYKYL